MTKLLPKKPQLSGGIATRIKPIAESIGAKATLIYGESGTGKTAVSGTWPTPALLIDFQEGGTQTIAFNEGISCIQLRDWKDMEDLYWHLKKNPKEFKTVILDQVTQMQEFGMVQVRKDLGIAPGDLMSRKSWGKISGMMKTWIQNFRDLRDLGIHVVFLAHQREDDGDEDGSEQIDPSVGARVMPSVASFLNGAVDIIGNTFIRERMVGPKGQRTKEVQYCLRVGPHAYYRTKIRVPMGSGIQVPEVLVNPTFEKLMRLSRGEVSSTPKKVAK